jgi:putative acetyltransferase
MHFLIRKSRPADSHRVVDIWRDSVDATHDFLAASDRVEIEEEVKSFLPGAPLWVVTTAGDDPVGFMLLSKNRLEALFIDPDYRGRGAGRALISHALRKSVFLSVDVNEQNAQAVGFYKRMGFKPIGRSVTDSEGRPYPLLHMILPRPMSFYPGP